METLEQLGQKYGTDKVEHQFLNFYDRYLEHIRNTATNILEIGVFQGSSLYMWHEYFPNAMIYGIDNETICDLSKINQNDRLKCFKIPQENRDRLAELNDLGEFDLILDDGLHFQEHQQVSFGYLFPRVKRGGYYIIEDLGLPEGRYANKSYNENWGHKDPNLKDNTLKMILDFTINNTLKSQHMLDSEIKYIENHVSRDANNNINIDLFIINRSSITAVIRKI